MSFLGDLFNGGGGDAGRVESSFVEYVTAAGQLIEARLAGYDHNRRGLLLCCAAQVCVLGGGKGAYAEAERVLGRHFDASAMATLRAVVGEIQKVVADCKSTPDRDQLPGITRFIEEHGTGDIATGLDAVCSVLAAIC